MFSRDTQTQIITVKINHPPIMILYQFNKFVTCRHPRFWLTVQVMRNLRQKPWTPRAGKNALPNDHVPTPQRLRLFYSMTPLLSKLPARWLIAL